MKIAFLGPARDEMRRSAHFYDRQRKGLGDEFLGEVETLLGRIREHPLAAPEIEPEIRSARVHRFPFQVVYTPEERRITVIAVMHNRRRPGYWRDRLGR